MEKNNYEGLNFYTDKISARDTATFKDWKYNSSQGKIGKLEPELVLDKFVRLFTTLGEIVGVDEKSWSLPIRGLFAAPYNFKMAQWYCKNAFAEIMLDKPLLREKQYENELVIFPSEYAFKLMLDKQK